VSGQQCRRGRIPADAHDQRLDKALSFLYPERSLRQRRKLFTFARVTLDGCPAAPGTRVSSGMEVLVRAPEHGVEQEEKKELRCPAVQVVACAGGLAGVSKPAGMHSARGRSRDSVQECLPVLFPGLEPVLLNRLDVLTSGLVMAALSREGGERYLAAQEQGAIRKLYLAVVRGVLGDRMEIRNRIDSAKRRKVRVLPGENPDPRRHTLVTPVRSIGANTLVRAEIIKGQRHQIRSHLAWLGFPIVGDPLYGDGKGSTMFLHHARIELAGFSAECPPVWAEAGLESVFSDFEE